MPGGLEYQRDRGGLFEAEIFRIRNAVHFRAFYEFGAAAVDHVAESGKFAAAVCETGQAFGAFSAGDSGGEDNFLADFHRGDVGADLSDFANDVAAGNVWKRDWNVGQTAAYPEIEMIQ